MAEGSGREPVYCYARSKQTREQCRRRVRLPGELCRWHGGVTPVVQARQELARGLGPSWPQAALVDPLESVREVLGQASAVVTSLKRTAEQSGSATDAQLAQFGDWLDRLGRFAKLALDVGAVHAGFEDRESQAVVWVMEAVLIDLGHDLADPAVRDLIKQRLLEAGAWLSTRGDSLPPYTRAMS